METICLHIVVTIQLLVQTKVESFGTNVNYNALEDCTGLETVQVDPNNVKYIPELIERLGGVDICFGGIGINGHVAFNEASDELSPEEFLQLQTRVLEIAKETRAVNSIGDLNGALDDMPHYCITIGINEISNARKIRLGCFRDWHRSVVRHAAYGEKSAHFPVSLLQGHPDINIRFTEFVANLPE